MTYRTLAATVATGALASAAARVAYRVLARRPPGGEQAWSRVNHRGEPVTLLEGPAAAAGALAAAALGGRNRVTATLAGAALMASSAFTRFGVFLAGRASARDPKYTVVPQRDRVRRQEDQARDAPSAR